MHREHADGRVLAEGRRIWLFSVRHLSLFYLSGVLLGCWIVLLFASGWDLFSIQGMASVLGIVSAVCLGIVPISLARQRTTTAEVDPSADDEA